jgi:hypothetical protein
MSHYNRHPLLIRELFFGKSVPKLVDFSCTQPEVGLLHFIQLDAASRHISRRPAAQHTAHM